ncbi:hypothetical protein R0137_02770 [Congregibacter brevis]|uniref:Multidrug transporter n=1 Tax=Congregibacter brevis TaxID=3081201 RepID=A0ABZ0IEN7_9GAMM|nr:hypothetical protein R0137_02770 [Congregibacter sp. IMCC45268]
MLAQLSQVKRHIGLILIALIIAPSGFAQSSIDEKPNGFAMAGDLVVARPIGLVMTAVGGAAFIVSLPFTALAGSVSESAESLVLGPAKETFVRCLGCRVSGYSYKDVERRRDRKEQEAEQAALEAAEQQ